MQASNETMTIWSELKETGDVLALSKLLKVTTVRASQIINSGSGSLAQIACIQKFYKERKKAISKINDDLN